MTGRLSTGIAIYGLQFQLGMIRDELERRRPGPDAAITTAERRLWGRARGAVKSAATNLENLTEALRPIERDEGEGRNVKELIANRKLKRKP